MTNLLQTLGKEKRITHQPRSMPSATRVATQKHMTSPEAIEASKQRQQRE